MARPSRITDAQILSAAHDLFMEKGLDATTLEIAKRAGISEGTIFKRFKTKEMLFSAVMTQDLFEEQWVLSLDDLVGEGDLLDNLKHLAHQMIVFFMGLVPKIQMMMARDGRMKQILMESPHSPPIVSLQRLMHFIEREQEIGRMKPCHPEMLARLLMSSTRHYAFMTHCDLNKLLGLPRDEFVSQTIDHIFGGLMVNSS
jgi:AcrR family transcriptional regulator